MFSKFVSIVENTKNLYKICALIKLYNRRNYYISKRKTTILILVLIDICKLLLTLRLEYEYFLEIIDNYLYRI